MPPTPRPALQPAEPGAATAGEVGPDDPSARATQLEAPATAAARILELAQRTADDYLAEAQRHAERIRGEAAGMENRVVGAAGVRV